MSDLSRRLFGRTPSTSALAAAASVGFLPPSSVTAFRTSPVPGTPAASQVCLAASTSGGDAFAEL